MNRQVKPNKFGKYKKQDILDAGFELIDYDGLFTATELERDFGIKLSHEQRLKHCVGFRCKQEWRGCIPVFNMLKIDEAIKKGEI